MIGRLDLPVIEIFRRYINQQLLRYIIDFDAGHLIYPSPD